MSANAVRLQLHALAYNLANFFRTLVLPDEVERWSLTTLRERVVKIGAKVIAHTRYAISRWLRWRFRGACFAVSWIRSRPSDQSG
jgi:DDE family transposase